ncbi:DUF4493 domain-containing protein [Flammeovirga sp. MY04]|uniref:DUF4493 domain-containing protein n=1 Tax=Flammeovirga sp. MY04 TaxID=1191459 RepID=UPI00080633D5|nr:DUF4493 domain-containing protein [Flammeovirga sp. MY04]ANQ51386.1 DUF4493 domain-containing protein [Flammeovirga sp. MY04]
MKRNIFPITALTIVPLLYFLLFQDASTNDIGEVSIKLELEELLSKEISNENNVAHFSVKIVHKTSKQEIYFYKEYNDIPRLVKLQQGEYEILALGKLKENKFYEGKASLTVLGGNHSIVDIKCSNRRATELLVDQNFNHTLFPSVRIWSTTGSIWSNIF